MFLKVLEDAGCYAGLCRACGRHFRIDGYQRLLPGLPGDHSDKSAQRLESADKPDAPTNPFGDRILSVSTAKLTDLRDSLSVVLSMITEMLKAT